MPAYEAFCADPLFAGTGLSPEGSRFAVLGSRPYWLYGFEMGANEKGLFIGNEAEGSRMPAEKDEGILGMDLLRFALEACDSAGTAVEFIGALLTAYGQNANASRLFDRRYENSFILADANEVWVMETAGRQWAAKKIPYYEAVSNCYTIGTDYDRCSPDMEKTVRENRFLHPDDPVDFAKAFTKPAIRQRFSVPRRNRMQRLIYDLLFSSLNEGAAKLISERLEKGTLTGEKELIKALLSGGARLDERMLMTVFSDHFEGEVNGFRFESTGGENCSVCMHANTQEEAKTAAGMLMSYVPGLGMRFYWAPASPCTSVYIPVWWVTSPTLSESMTKGGEFYSEDSLWWKAERLVSLVSVCEERYADEAAFRLDDVKLHIENEEKAVEGKALSLVRSGAAEEAQKLLDSFTAEIAGELEQAVTALNADISGDIAGAGGLYGPMKEFLEAYSARTGMPL